MRKTKEDIIEEYMTIKFVFVDFFYEFCSARGIDDPETELSDEEYEKLENECKSKITTEMLSSLRSSLIQDANERINALMN